MVDAPLNVRVDRHLRRLFGLMALYMLCNGIIITSKALTNDPVDVREAARLQILLVTCIACFIPLATGFVYLYSRRWYLESEAVKIFSLFRRHEIPWNDVASLRIESFNDGTTQKLILRESSGNEFTINMAEVVLKGKGRVAPTEWQLPEKAREKTEIVVNPGPNWGALVAMLVFGVTIMVWLAVQIRSMAPR